MRGGQRFEFLLIGAVGIALALLAVLALLGFQTLALVVGIALLASLLLLALLLLLRLRREVRGLTMALDRQQATTKELRKILGRGPGSLSAKRRHDTIRDTAALLTLYTVSPPDAGAMPLTDYSALPDTAVLLQDEIRRLAPGATVVELGSGATTVWMALAAARAELPVRILSLDSSEEWAEVTRAALERNGVAHLVELRAAALEPYGAAGTPWYEHAAWNDVETIDLLFVDGPPGSGSPRARFPVVEAFGPLLAPEARVVIDDADRPDEQAMIGAWQQLHGERPFTQVGRRERVVVLQRREPGADVAAC